MNRKLGFLMNRKLTRWMKKAIVALYAGLVLALAAATWLEHFQGSAVVHGWVYGAGWFFAAWALLAVGVTVVAIRYRWWKRGAVGGLHLSFVLILAGAALTALTGCRGYVHLQSGEPVNHYVDSERHGLEPLPFTVQLDSFRIRLHRSTLTPSDYVSYLRIDGQPVRVSMNRVLERQHYRFYQSSYDEDGSSWLSVNCDPWGIALTYMGYVGWGVSAVGVLLASRSRFRCRQRRSEMHGTPGSGEPYFRTVWLEAGTVAAGAVLLVLLVLFGLRWKSGGHIPLSNGFETLLFLSICTLAVALAGRRRAPLLLPLGGLSAAASLAMAFWGPMDTSVSPLAPVLASPLLGFHVATIMVGYALLALLFAGGVAGMLLPRRREELMRLGRLLLYPAVFFLGAGIFLGAVWANQSWGRYWAWDSKEVWALITFMVYAVAFHHRSFPWLRRPLCFHRYMVVAFLAVLMTYFGVNFLLGGMHSYAMP